MEYTLKYTLKDKIVVTKDFIEELTEKPGMISSISKASLLICPILRIVSK